MTQGQTFYPIVKNKKVIIFDASKVYKATKKTLKKHLGFLSLALSLALFLVFLTPTVITPKIIKEKNKGFKPVIAKEIKPTKKNFLLSIDKLGLINAKVIKEVNIADETAYSQALNQGLAHAKDTGFPGQGKLVYIFGHSTNYPWFVKELNALFFNLETLEAGDELKQGDEIRIEYNGEYFYYSVYDKKIVEANEVNVIDENQDKDILILQACWPPGTIWKRLLIFAKPFEI